MLNGGMFVAPALFATEVGASVSRRTQNTQRARTAVAQLYALSMVTLVPMDQALIDEATTIAVDFALKGADSYFVAVAKGERRNNVTEYSSRGEPNYGEHCFPLIRPSPILVNLFRRSP